MKKKIIIIVSVIVIILSVFIYILLNYSNKNINVEKLNALEKNVYNFLIDNMKGKYISTSDSIGSAYPEGYIFLSNGNFSYDDGSYSPSRDGKILSLRGTWNIKNNMLVLEILEKQIANGGYLVEDLIEGSVLVDYKKVVEKSSDIYKYKIDNIYTTEDGRMYLSFKDSDIKLFQLSILDIDDLLDDGYLSNMRVIANEGYNN